MSRGVTRNSGPLQIIFPSRALHPYPRALSSFHSLLQHLTWRPTWLADQPAHLANAKCQAAKWPSPNPPLQLLYWNHWPLRVTDCIGSRSSFRFRIVFLSADESDDCMPKELTGCMAVCNWRNYRFVESELHWDCMACCMARRCYSYTARE